MITKYLCHFFSCVLLIYLNPSAFGETSPGEYNCTVHESGKVKACIENGRGVLRATSDNHILSSWGREGSSGGYFGPESAVTCKRFAGYVTTPQGEVLAGFECTQTIYYSNLCGRGRGITYLDNQILKPVATGRPETYSGPEGYHRSYDLTFSNDGPDSIVTYKDTVFSQDHKIVTKGKRVHKVRPIEHLFHEDGTWPYYLYESNIEIEYEDGTYAIYSNASDTDVLYYLKNGTLSHDPNALCEKIEFIR